MNIKDRLDLLNILDQQEKNSLFFIFFLMIIASVLEVLSIGAIIPLIQYLVNFNESDLVNNKILIQLSKFMLDNSLLNISIFVLLVFVFRNFFLLFLVWYKSKFALFLNAKWKDKLFNLYLSQNYTFHLSNNSAILIRNIQQEVSQCINSYITPLLDFWLNFIILTLIIFFLIYYDPINTLIIIILFGSFSIIINLFLKKILFQIGEIRQSTSLKMLQYMQEGLANIVNIKMLNVEKFFLHLFKPHNIKMARYGVKRSVYGALPKFFFEILFIFLIIVSIIYVALNQGSLQNLFSKLIIFSIAALRIIPALNSLSISYQKIRFGRPALNVIYNQFKNLKIYNRNSKLSKKFSIKDNISIENLSFKHANSEKYLFNKINLKIEGNKINGIIGPNGSGKSTLINLICGLLTPNDGYIKLNGTNILDHLNNWQRSIGFIPQNFYMIDGTIESNIAFGVDKSNIESDKIEKVMRLTELDKDYKKNYFIGEQGRLLSGGQKQKIAICRALYHEPELLIFDEPTSALDSEAEKRFIDNFIKSSNKTVILVSHKEEPLKYCDLIFELKDGKIIKHLNNESR